MTDKNIKYDPSEDEKRLSYLINENMTDKEKLKALSDAFWQVNNNGYGDAMANLIMSGEESAKTKIWEKNCKEIEAINRLYDHISKKN